MWVFLLRRHISNYTIFVYVVKDNLKTSILFDLDSLKALECARGVLLLDINIYRLSHYKIYSLCIKTYHVSTNMVMNPQNYFFY